MIHHYVEVSAQKQGSQSMDCSRPGQKIILETVGKAAHLIMWYLNQIPNDP